MLKLVDYTGNSPWETGKSKYTIKHIKNWRENNDYKSTK
jgi:hypothetical protein